MAVAAAPVVEVAPSVPAAPAPVARVDWDAPLAVTAPAAPSPVKASAWQADHWAKDLKQRLAQIPASQNLLRTLLTHQKR
jgi:hypothetical protein